MNCFKSLKHAGCSESFYKDCFLQEMNSNHVSKEDKVKMMKMIRNFEESEQQQEEEDEVPDSLHKRLEGVDIDDAESIWMKLTPEEQKDFHQSVENGHLIEEWNPWWNSHDTTLIAEIGESVKIRPTKFTAPESVLQVPKLSTLMRGKEPSPLIRNNLFEVLYSYVHCCHKYNGEIQEFPSEAAYEIVFSSTFLSKGITAASIEAIPFAIDSCSQKNTDSLNHYERIEGCLDVYHILLGPSKDDMTVYTKAAIAQLHSCCTTLKHHRKNFDLKASLLNNVLKKLEFLYSWVEDNGLKLLPLAVEALSIYKMNSHSVKEHKDSMACMEGARDRLTKKGSQLIQELP